MTKLNKTQTNVKTLPRRRKNLPLIAIGVICILLIVLFAASRISGENQSNFKSNLKSNLGSKGEINSASDAANYLAGFGWEVAGTPSAVKTVQIPSEFDKIYTEYNNLQKTQNFNLENYRGKTAVMYTFKILNHSATNTDVFGNVLVCGNEVIAGDVVSYAIDGFLTGLKRE